MTLPAELVFILRQRRRELGLRQLDLAARVGVSVTAPGRWERREAEPGLGGLCAWVEELGLDMVLTTRGTKGPPCNL